MRSLRRVALVVGVIAAVAVVAVGLLRPSQAGAHALRMRSIPEQNREIQTAPERVQLWFTEEIEPQETLIRVLACDGTKVDTGDTRSSDDPLNASVGLQPDLEPGVYTVVWENLSRVDGHFWKGFFPFIVLNLDGSRPVCQEGSAALLDGGSGQGFLPNWGDAALRWAGLLSAVGLAGSALFYLTVLRPAASTLSDAAGRSESARSGSCSLSRLRPRGSSSSAPRGSSGCRSTVSTRSPGSMTCCSTRAPASFRFPGWRWRWR